MELRVGDDGAGTRLDCRVEVGASTPARDLRDGLARHAANRGVPVPAGARLWTVTGEPVDDEAPVAHAGVTSGQRLWLRSSPPPPDPTAGEAHVGVEVTVVSGPDLGPAVVLGPGTHRVGGTPDDDVALIGGGLPGGAAVIEVAPDGTVRAAGMTGDRYVVGPFEPACGRSPERHRSMGAVASPSTAPRTALPWFAPAPSPRCQRHQRRPRPTGSRSRPSSCPWPAAWGSPSCSTDRSSC